MYRKIIHLDLDAFFCAVEEIKNPELVGQPFAVGGRPDQRGVVASCSYTARKFGVRSAMPTARAIRLCPSLKIVSSNHKTYSQVSRKVMEQLFSVTDLVEQISIDEAFLDVTHLQESGGVLARQLQSAIQTELNLPCSLGVASNKLVAKIATDFGKFNAHTSGPPNAIHIVPPGHEARFLAPLPVSSLWGVGPKMSEKLAGLGIHTIGDLALWSEPNLIQNFGKYGHHLALQAKGIDDQPVTTFHPIKSISNETTFSRDISDREKLRETLKWLSNKVSERLRKEQLVGSTIKLKLRFADFTTLTRQATLDHPTDLEAVIFSLVDHLFVSVWQHGQPVRLLGVGISKLRKPVGQLTLWESIAQSKDKSAKEQRLQASVKQIHARFGNQMLKWNKSDKQE